MAPDIAARGGLALAPQARSNMRTDDIVGAQPRRQGFQRGANAEQMLGMGGIGAGPASKM